MVASFERLPRTNGQPGLFIDSEKFLRQPRLRGRGWWGISMDTHVTAVYPANTLTARRQEGR